MKKSIFINICIITSQCLFRISSTIESIEFIKMIPILAFFGAISRLRHIFISRESRIKKNAVINGFKDIDYITENNDVRKSFLT